MSTLKSLGSATTKYEYANPSSDILESFDNPHQYIDYQISHNTDEFTSLCPVTGQPDFATIEITIVPGKLCVESKSLKLYLMSYRNHGAFMENIIGTITKDLVTAIQPKYCSVIGKFKSRGGIATQIQFDYESKS